MSQTSTTTSVPLLLCRPDESIDDCCSRGNFTDIDSPAVVSCIDPNAMTGDQLREISRARGEEWAIRMRGNYKFSASLNDSWLYVYCNMILVIIHLEQVNRMQSKSKAASIALGGGAAGASTRKPPRPPSISHSLRSRGLGLAAAQIDTSSISFGSVGSEFSDSTLSKRHAAEALVGRCHPRDASFPQNDRESRFYNPFVWCGVEVAGSDRTNFAWDLERGAVLRRRATDESSIAVQINGTPCNEQNLASARARRQRRRRVVDFMSRFGPEDAQAWALKM